MKLPLVLLVAFAATSVTFAEDAVPKWDELEKLLRGPMANGDKPKPKNQEEMKAFYKDYLTELDARQNAYLKANPNDVHRWDIAINEVKIGRMREALGVPGAKKPEAILKEIDAAADAPAGIKAEASFLKIMMDSSGDDEAFRKAAAEHLGKFPDYQRNNMIQSRLKALDAAAEVKKKPLDIAFKAIDGSEVDITKMKGKVVLVDFWATWCGPCMAEVPHVVETYKKLHEKGFEIVGISFDQDKSKLEKTIKEKGMTWVQFFDGKGWQNEIGQRFGINSIPAMWLVNKKGMVVDTEGRTDLEEKVTKLLKE